MLAPHSCSLCPIMIRKTLTLLAAGLFCMAAAPAKKPAQPAPAKPAAAPAAAVDARDPASLVAVLATLDAKAQVARRDGDSVFVTVTSPTEVFSAQFAGCDEQGHACQAVLFDRLGQGGAPSEPQINAFNQTSVMCRVYADHSGKPHVEYSTLLFPTMGRPELLMHINAWRGCIGDFTQFLKDPVGFLAQAA
jgi:hypothetical protein